MNRIARRSKFAWVLILLLLAGVVGFVVEYVSAAGQWVVFQGNPHVYTGSNIGCGQIFDRDGVLLLDSVDGREYARESAVRKATLHWLGDRSGFISAPAVSHYSQEMSGYSLLNGLYAYAGQTGKATMTLSAQVQKAALEAMGDRKGTVAVYNYKTGEILCAVSTPTYDPDNVPDVEGDTTGAYSGVYLNRFTQSSYVPGSIFKVVTAAAALETMDNALELEFRCDGSYELDPDEVTCGKAHGQINLKTALAQSCNCYFAQLVQTMGGSTLERYVKKFEILEPVSFDGIRTASGTFDIQGAAAVEVAWSGIGQHKDLVNPARFMTFMGAIAGGGSGAEPYVVSRVESGNTVSYEASTSTTGRLLSAQTAEILRELMEYNVQRIYGADHFPGLTVCAKSGTAEVGVGLTPNATFAGFVADEEYPLAFVVVVENGGAGSSVCVPILSKVLAQCKELLD